MAKLIKVKHENGKTYLVSQVKADDLVKNRKGFSIVGKTAKEKEAEAKKLKAEEIAEEKKQKAIAAAKAKKENKEVESRETK